MSLIRPEARATLARYAGLWVPGLGLILGLWWAVFSWGLLRVIGIALVLICAGFAIAGWQRLRFHSADNGPGVVRIDEGQVAYFGPLSGGAVARSELSTVTLDHTGKPAHWLLSQPGQADLAIPVTASGADALFDLFTGLPGIKTEKILAELHDTTPRRVVLWSQSVRRLH